MNHRPLIAVATLALAWGGSVVSAEPAARAWKAYVNVRFNYSVCFPADLLTPEAEAPNGDGRRFTGKDGAEMLVYGSNNALRTTVPAAARQAGTRLGTVTYSAIKPRWFVVSGNKGASDFYAKSLFDDSQIKSFELTYPHAAAAVWQPVVASLNACFHNTKR